MRTMTQFSVWLIYLAAKGSVYMSGCYWFSLPTFTLRNIIKSDFYFLPNRVDSRGAAQTEGQLHTYCTVLLHKRRRRWGILWVFFFYFYTFLGTVFCWDLALWATKWEVCNPQVSQRLACRDGRRGGVRKSEGGLDGVKETEMWRESEEEVKKRVGGRKRRRGAFRRWLKRRERDTNWWGEGRGGEVGGANEWRIKRWRGKCCTWTTGCRSHLTLNHRLLVLLLLRKLTSHVNMVSQRHVDYDESVRGGGRKIAVTSSGHWFCP